MFHEPVVPLMLVETFSAFWMIKIDMEKRVVIERGLPNHLTFMIRGLIRTCPLRSPTIQKGMAE